MKSNIEQARQLANEFSGQDIQTELLARTIYQNHLLEKKLKTVTNSLMYYNIIITMILLACLYFAGVASGNIV